MRARPGVAFVLLAACLASCRGDPPTAPSPELVRVSVDGAAPAVGATSQFSATATWSDGRTQVVTVLASWSSSAPAVATVTAGLVTGVGPGEASITATFQGVSGTAAIALDAPPDVGLTPFMRDYIEALFLGMGPLTPTDGVRGCPTSFGTWVGFPPGTHVELLVSTTVPSTSAAAIASAAATVPDVSGGALTVTASDTPEDDPLPGLNQVTATMHPDPISLGCSFAQGCTRFTFLPGRSQIASARAILRTGQFTGAYVHDAVGHGVLGLCHVDGTLIGGARLSLMSFGPGVFSNQLPFELTEFDRRALDAVFRSGLTAGATRAAFVAAGLVDPGPVDAAGMPAAAANGLAQIPALPIR